MSFNNRRRSRRDKAEPAIVAALEASGWSVLKISTQNGPDLAASRAGWTVMIEVKSGKAKLRPGQKAWADSWLGPAVVLRTVEDVLMLNRSRGMTV